MLSPRNRELLGLVPSALLVVAGFTAIFIQAENTSGGADTNVVLNHASSVSLTYGAIFLALCVAGHLVIRFALPDADPYLFPLAAVLASVGIVMVYRINPALARQQAQWMVVGLIGFALTILQRRNVVSVERVRAREVGATVFGDIEVGASRVNNGSVAYALRIFGRSPRAAACDCERSMDPGLVQKLFVMTDQNLVVTKFQAGNGRLQTLIKSKKTDDEALEELFLATVGRFPNEQDKKYFAEHKAHTKDRGALLSDTLWALINTREFILNH